MTKYNIRLRDNSLLSVEADDFSINPDTGILILSKTETIVDETKAKGNLRPVRTLNIPIKHFNKHYWCLIEEE